MDIQKIGITGVTGRMGRMLTETVAQHPQLQLSAAFEQLGHPSIGRPLSEVFPEISNIPGTGGVGDVVVSENFADGIKRCDCVIDFTRPSASLAYLSACTAQGVPLVIGTTGFSAEEKLTIAAAGQTIPLVFSPNMSIGVNVTFKLLAIAAELLQSGYDVEIIEAHHHHKVDAPSGTALQMGEIIANARKVNLADCAVYDRSTLTKPRDNGSIGFSAIRGGDIVGDHTVMFCGIGERIEITHKSSSRQSYAAGAVAAALFLRQKSAGLYTMQDVMHTEQRA